MATKRTTTKSKSDEQATGSDFSLQEDDAKRAKLELPSETTLEDLPFELLEYILGKVVVQEVRDAKLAKIAWKKRADAVINRLSLVCSRWDDILTTDYFRNEVHRVLEGTAQELTRMETVQKSALRMHAIDVTTLKDEMFVLWPKCLHGNSIHVYDRNDLTVEKAVIRLPKGNPLTISACRVSNCVYLLNRKQWFKVSVLRIARDDDDQFIISPMLAGLCLPNPTMSVSANGVLILSKHWGTNCAVVSIYNADGSLQHEMSLPKDVSGLTQIVPKSNGNLILVSNEKGQFGATITEIDLNGVILHQYLASFNCGQILVSQADIHGRMLIFERLSNKAVLIDSELNLLDLTGTPQDPINYPYFASMLRYDCERNEIVSLFKVGSHPISFLAISPSTD